MASAALAQYLREHPKLTIIDVTGAQSATTGNVHTYFRGSPSVSNDILMSLRYDLPPGERGLVLNEDATIWRFPKDYISRLRNRLEVNTPDSPNL